VALRLHLSLLSSGEQLRVPVVLEYYLAASRSSHTSSPFDSDPCSLRQSGRSMLLRRSLAPLPEVLSPSTSLGDGVSISIFLSVSSQSSPSPSFCLYQSSHWPNFLCARSWKRLIFSEHFSFCRKSCAGLHL
jgi:hypothetical protein